MITSPPTQAVQKNFIPKRQILDRGKETCRAHGIEIGNVQVETISPLPVTVSDVLDDLRVIIAKVRVFHDKGLEHALRRKVAKCLAAHAFDDLRQVCPAAGTIDRRGRSRPVTPIVRSR